MKNTILVLSIALAVFMGISCKKSSSTTTNKTTTPPSTTSTQTVNVGIQWVYSGSNNILENQLSYKINNGSVVVLSIQTAVTYTSTLVSVNRYDVIAQASITVNKGDVIYMYGQPLETTGLNKFTIQETDPNSTVLITNGVQTGTCPLNGGDQEYITTSGATTFSFTMH